MDEPQNENAQEDFSPDQIIQELRATFREEAYELLTELEAALLEIEKTPDDKEQIGRAFRAMHTIKGSGGACEFHDIVAFTHKLETIFEKIRSGKARATKEIVDLTLSARDQIKAMLDRYYNGGSVDESRSDDILASLHDLAPGAGQNVPKVSGKSVPLPSPGARQITYRIRFRPHVGIFTQGTDPVRLLNELSQLGMCNIVAHTEAIPFLEDMDPQGCYTSWDAILTTDKGVNAIQDVFIFIKDASGLEISVIDDERYRESETMYKKLGEILLERGEVTTEDLKKALSAGRRVGDTLIERGIVAPAEVESALVEQRHIRELREQRRCAELVSSIRVATKKLDSLVDLVGELVTVQARLNRTASSIGNAELLAIAEEVERLTGALRENAMNVRMLPIGTTFSKFKRLVHDLSAELCKEIELTTEGAETELDKTVIERLSDPLVHIIRNCIDHGIEFPAVREASGKSRQGSIHLMAAHSGASVLIRVADDGAGVDMAAIRERAVEKGLIGPDAELSGDQVKELIFAPGFSTAKTVTGVSGRGVGMDVVKKAIDVLGGSIELESLKGGGTTITLKLPLTLAIIDGFLTSIGKEHFIFPLSLVQECIEHAPEDDQMMHGRRLVNLRGSIVPYIRLREQFLIKAGESAREQIVVTNVNGHRVGFVVDAVIGEQQTVLKSLGRFYRDVDGISGATILGDGTVALILDIPKLVRLAEQEESVLQRQ
jgi:two-component system chemotaxis sensor kinase CheA